MPNGSGFSENEWATWRGMVTNMLASAEKRDGEMVEWMRRHEQEEFGYHNTVATHMADTKGWIAQSSQHRIDLAQRVSQVELVAERIDQHVQTVDKTTEGLRTRLNILFSTLVPIGAWAIWQLIEHFRTTPH